MYRRLIILSVIILAALCGLACLGYHSIHIWAQGIEGTRIGQFAEVAEQIRQDVKDKLDKFMEAEQKRDYTEYQNYYVPDNVAAGQQQMPLLRSPLAGSLEHGLAYNNFQIDPDGTVTTPNDDIRSINTPYAAGLDSDFYAEVDLNRRNVKDNVLPALGSVAPNSFMLAFEQKTELPQKAEPSQKAPQKVSTKSDSSGKDLAQKKLAKTTKYRDARIRNYPIESLQNPEQRAQIIKQSREVFASNVAQSTGGGIAFDNTTLNEREQSTQTAQSNYETIRQPTQGSRSRMLEDKRRASTSKSHGGATQQEQDEKQQVASARLSDSTERFAEVLPKPEEENQYEMIAESLQEKQNKAPDNRLRPSVSRQRYTPGEPERLKEGYSYSTTQSQLKRQAAGTSASLNELSQQAQRLDQEELSQPQAAQARQTAALSLNQQQSTEQGQADMDMVEIRIEPFVPLVVPGKTNEQTSAISAEASIFDGQVFMLRHVRIEDEHFIQGFQLNEAKLIEEIKESANRFMREDMDFELAQTTNGNVAYAAILDFGFGNLVLNLLETNPDWIAIKIGELRNWYFSIITVVLVAVMLGLAGLWRNARAQLKLAQKKDDFISAVSHELRTPLTSIRMYSEMLEKDWVKSEDKVTEYYKNMRQESERLSRLIENVLDFSRIQRGRKKYAFTLGDINKYIADVVEMMRPYATQSGFSIKTKFEHSGQVAFDGDAVTQIVVNLLDNAIKYARNAEDKTIMVRTKSNDRFILIEVEDHGPGVPLRQRKKIFEEFYRVGAEATRETTGTGLGLALVKKFAQAHNGFVEILNARPTGAIFRVALAAQT